MRIILYNFTLLFFVFAAQIAVAQQDPGYTQYMYNTLTVNPAYAGSTGNLEVALLHRSQWVGIDGAPTTQSLGVHAPLRNEQIGLGLSVVNDNLGPSNEVYVDGNFSYTIPLGVETQLAFGIKGGARMLNIDWSKGRYYNQTDNLLNNNVNNKISPSVGAGAFLYTDKWYVGLSAPNFIKGDYYDDVRETIDLERVHYFLTAGYVFDLTDDIKFKPAFLARGVAGAPLVFDVSANFLFSEKFMLGASYRHDDSVTALAGIQVWQDFFVGYSYDYTTTDLNKYNDGSHEIVLRFQLSKKSGRIKSQRFF